MASVVESVEQKWKRTYKIEAPDKQSYDAVYIVEWDSIPTLAELNGVFTIGTVLSSLYLKSIDWAPIDEGDNGEIFWLAKLNYSNELSEQEQEPDPLLRPAIVTYSFGLVQKIFDRDKNDAYILNSAHDQYSPGIEGTAPSQQITIEKNLSSFDADFARSYVNKINSNTFLGLEQYEGKISGITASQQTEGEVTYWRVQVSIEVNFDLWEPIKILDAGFNYIDTDKKYPAKSEDGENYSEPQLLDGSGGLLDIGEDPVPKEYSIYNTANFNAMGIYP